MSAMLVETMKRLYYSGVPVWELARMFDISESEVVKIVHPQY